jgi:hypothetical protein
MLPPTVSNWSDRLLGVIKEERKRESLYLGSPDWFNVATSNISGLVWQYCSHLNTTCFRDC